MWFIGNHDIWIFDYLPSELGIEVVDGSLVEEIDGKIFFMTHGDGIGRLKPSFRFFSGDCSVIKRVRRLFGNTSTLDSSFLHIAGAVTAPQRSKLLPKKMLQG